MAAAIRVGISSWADPALIESGRFYPRKSMRAEDRLRFYASVFDTVEVNSSYYAIPDARTTARWAARTPPGFVFHVKAYRLLTGHHPPPESLPAEVARLLPARPRLTSRGEVQAGEFPEEALDEAFRLFRAALGPLAEAGKLGYVLFQLAPWVRYDEAWLEYLASVPRRLPGWTPAIEFRHRTWLPDHRADTLAALRAAGLAHVVVDGPTAAGAVPRVPVVTARTAVLRLHGRNDDGWRRQARGEAPEVREKYDYLYTDAELRELAADARELGNDAEHVYVSFNNNNRDYPVRNALAFKRLLGQAIAETPDLFAPLRAPGSS